MLAQQQKQVVPPGDMQKKLVRIEDIVVKSWVESVKGKKGRIAEETMKDIALRKE